MATEQPHTIEAELYVFATSVPSRVELNIPPSSQTLLAAGDKPMWVIYLRGIHEMLESARHG